MTLRPSLAVAVGAVAGFVGIVVLFSGVFDELLPANRLLGAVISSLIATWTLLRVVSAWKDRS